MAQFDKKLIAALGLLACTAVAPAFAASSTSSAASEGSSASVGSLSTSVETSSHSSTKTTDVAQGDYRITDMATLPERPGTVRLKLQALANPGPTGEVLLYVPQGTVDQGDLAPGQVIAARQRPYGVEFANGPKRTAFFLALSDDWYRELQTRAVAL